MSHTDKTPQQNNEGFRQSRQKAIPAQRIIKAMSAKIKQATKNNIKGEIFCLQAMFPAYAGE